MGKFSKAGGREMPELNTSSLPDLVFAFLFFIMMVTSMREVTLKVQFQLPQATELQKLEKKRSSRKSEENRRSKHILRTLGLWWEGPSPWSTPWVAMSL